MPSGQFNTVVISVSDILPLDKGHYISVKIKRRFIGKTKLLLSLRTSPQTGVAIRTPAMRSIARAKRAISTSRQTTI